MRTLSRFLPVIILITLFSGCKDHEISMETITQNGLSLSPLQEVPQKNSPATGSFDVSYNKTTKMLTYTLTWSNLTGNPIGSHIHGTASRGVNAGVKHDFTAPLPKTTSGTFSNSVLVDGVNIIEADLLNGLYYFNIHTPANPGGEIRGQIEFYNQHSYIIKKGIVLTGAQEVPPKVTAATGTADVFYNKNTKMLSYFVTWNNLTGVPTGSHIHGPAAMGVNAAVIHNFFPLIPLNPSGSFSNAVLVDEVALKEAELLNGLYYFNFHTPTNPGGEIRGQIVF